jgi:outer membrane biosynthesis protein TonB
MGVCGELEPEPAYPLDNIDENGESTTVVDATLDDLLAEDHAIDMHLAPNELGTLIACADIDGEPELPEGATPEASPEATPAETPTEAVTPTVISDGTGGAVPTEPAVAVATETETAADQAVPAPTEAAPTPAPTEEPTSVPTEIPVPAPTEATTPVDSLPSGKGDVSDGTGGPGSTAPVAADSPMPPVASTGDGTAGVSGKGDPVSATTLPQQAGVGSALIWPDNPAMAMMWATTVAAVILGSSAWIIRRGERSTMTPSSRWTRMGI